MLERLAISSVHGKDHKGSCFAMTADSWESQNSLPDGRQSRGLAAISSKLYIDGYRYIYGYPGSILESYDATAGSTIYRLIFSVHGFLMLLCHACRLVGIAKQSALRTWKSHGAGAHRRQAVCCGWQSSNSWRQARVVHNTRFHNSLARLVILDRHCDFTLLSLSLIAQVPQFVARPSDHQPIHTDTKERKEKEHTHTHTHTNTPT